MRILLVHPPLSPNSEITPPLGLCTLASWLLHLGHEVRIVDLDLEIKDSSKTKGAGYVQLFKRHVKDFVPQVVGITSMYNNSLQAECLMRAIKEIDPSVITVAGGSHFGALGRRSLERIPELDFVIEGEGEQSFGLLLAALDSKESLSNIPRLCYRVDREIVCNKPGQLLDLSNLPVVWPALAESIDLAAYTATIAEGSPRRAIYIEAGRGCPFACSFCATAPFWQRKYRVKPVLQIVEEIRFLYERYCYDSFILVHDLLTVDKEFIFEFSDAMFEARLPVEWMANHRTDLKLHGLLPKMKASGCWKLFLGVESASAQVQKEMHKNLVMDDVVATIRELDDHGISATCSFVMGFPNESSEALSQTLNMGARLKLFGVEIVQFHRLRTWPPAPLAKSCLPAEFDLDSLRIEYPFVNIPDDDIAAIKSDPEFFAGYFAPVSKAGSFAQLAQVEMFFDFAVALVPLTIAGLASLLGDDLVKSYYEVLSECEDIKREELEFGGTRLFQNWLVIEPMVRRWISKQSHLETWKYELLTGLLAYESKRLEFLSDGELPLREGLSSNSNWVAFEATVNINGIVEALREGYQLTPGLNEPKAFMIIRKPEDTFDAYQMDSSLAPELIARGPALLDSLNNGIH